MRAGELRKRVTLQRLVAGRDSLGGVTESWEDVGTYWAAVEPLKGHEFFAASQVNAEVTGRIRMRYRPGVDPTMRAALGTRVFAIQAVIDVDERHRELHLMVREVV